MILLTTFEENERARCAALHAYDVLDTPPDPTLDRITGLAAELLDTPMAAISLIDAERQWMKSRLGGISAQMPRSIAFCNHTISGPLDVTLLVPDARLDARFQENPLVTGAPGVRFYLGAPLVTPQGHAIGALCVLDTHPHADVGDRDRRRLQVLAQLVVDELELRRAAKQVHEAQRLLTLAESMAGVGHWRLRRRDGRMTWSDEVYRIHGVEPGTYDPNLESGISWYHPEDQAKVAGAVEVAFQTKSGFDFELRLRRLDGALRHVTARAVCELDAAGEAVALFGVFQDVTASRTLLEQVSAEHERYRLLADNANDMISTTSMSSEILFVTPGVKRVLGYEPEEIVGRSMLALTHPDDVPRVKALLKALVTAGPDAPPQPYQFRGRRKDGSWAWLEGQPRVQRDAAGAPTAVQDVVRDITARKRLEGELEAAKIAAEAASRAKSDFLANMSHELRTPLNSIIGFTHVLVRDESLRPEHRHQLLRIEEAGKGLLTVVNDVLDFSKLEAEGVVLSPRPFSPVRLVEHVVALAHPQATDKGLSLVVDYPYDRQGLVLGDVDRLRQVLTNLVGNAIKFTTSGEVRLGLQARGRDGRVQLRFQVADSGIGIAADEIETLFKRFAQADGSISRRYGGTGLGLAISKRLIEAMDGSIEVWSELGHGSTFEVSVELPMAEAAVPAEPLPAAPARPAAGAGPLPMVRILVAEDVPVNQELVRLMLAPLGCDLTVVSDGEQAVDAIAATAFDLVLMDMQMPVLDGLEATRLIRRLGGRAARTPIVALTANVLPEHIERCQRVGMDDHVAKPFVTEDLQSMVLKWTEPARTAPAPGPVSNPILDDLIAQIGVGPIQRLLAGLHTQIAQIEATNAHGEPAALSRLAHSLRGAAGSLGYVDAAQACQAVEAAHRAGAPTGAAFQALQAACAAARAALEQRLAA